MRVFSFQEPQLTGVVPANPKIQFCDALGVPLAIGTVDVYLAGTTTRTTTWQDKTQLSQNTNPIELDSRGECVIWGDSTVTYKYVLKNAAGVTQYTVDNIPGGADTVTVQAAIDALGKRALLLLVCGQSNATRRAPKVTNSYPPKLLCFVGANESADRTDSLSLTNALGGSVFASTIPFSEFGVSSESSAPGIAIADNAYKWILTHTPARAGYHYRDLMTGKGAWADIENAMRYGRTLLVGLGATSIDTWVIWDDGESDASNVPPGGSGSEGPITKIQATAIQQDLVTNINQTAALMHNTPGYIAPVLCVQMCLCAGSSYRNLQSGQVEAARSVSGYYLAGPRYAYTYETDGTHMTGLGRRLNSEYCAYRMTDIAAGRLLPVHIASATRSGAVVTATFETIQGDLVIDTTNVPDTTTAYTGSKYGFEYYYSGSQIAVSSVTVSAKVATITLASTPAGAGELRYAQMTWPGGAQVVAGSGSKLARGCIRDSGSHTALYDGSTLYNWACHQTIATN